MLELTTKWPNNGYKDDQKFSNQVSIDSEINQPQANITLSVDSISDLREDDEQEANFEQENDV